MAAGNDIDVFGTRLFERRTYAAKLFAVDNLSHSFPRNLIVLAKTAAQIAAAYKNRSGAAPSRKRRFFTEMQACRSDFQIGRFFAKTRLSRSAVYAAAARTQGTRRIRIHGDVYKIFFATNIDIKAESLSMGNSSAS